MSYVSYYNGSKVSSQTVAGVWKLWVLHLLLYRVS